MKIRLHLQNKSSDLSVKYVNVNTMTVALLGKDIEDKMKSELHTVSPLTTRVRRTIPLHSEKEIQWNKLE